MLILYRSNASQLILSLVTIYKKSVSHYPPMHTSMVCHQFNPNAVGQFGRLRRDIHRGDVFPHREVRIDEVNSSSHDYGSCTEAESDFCSADTALPAAVNAYPNLLAISPAICCKVSRCESVQSFHFGNSPCV